MAHRANFARWVLLREFEGSEARGQLNREIKSERAMVHGIGLRIFIFQFHLTFDGWFIKINLYYFNYFYLSNPRGIRRFNCFDVRANWFRRTRTRTASGLMDDQDYKQYAYFVLGKNQFQGLFLRVFLHAWTEWPTDDGKRRRSCKSRNHACFVSTAKQGG
ncbi:hypothetical protein B0X71_20815 (plasmid) [Planococcus lenghuensis]|uniref:Uncharacterized protein n=1 Tax=Planococcus lenghuensis TaxID=2213202 RepID=A0A1Q2L5A0_9BACL|nr:hypothetical protein B0X71_20815 [Planococcus lenghuensis]